MEALILNFLTSSGPMIVYPLAAFVFYIQNKKIQSLEDAIEKLDSSFMEFKLEHGRTSVKSEAIQRIESAIERNNMDAVARSAEIFSQLREINRNGCARIGACNTTRS